MKIVFEYKDFWSNFTKTSKNFPIFSGDISRFLLLQANLSLRACLAMCLIFRENPGSRAYKRVAYKKKMCSSFGQKRHFCMVQLVCDASKTHLKMAVTQ